MRKSGPEKIVEWQVRNWARAQGFDLTVVDTAARFSTASGRYKKNMTASESLPDLIGNYKYVSVWIELKAPGCRSSINRPKSRHQRDFLIRKIQAGCFACVTDSVEHLGALWARYKASANRSQTLLEDLPILTFRPRGALVVRKQGRSTSGRPA